MEIIPAEGRSERKKYCRVCGSRVRRFNNDGDWKKCVVCLHRTHSEHMAGNKRVCALCSREECNIPQEYQIRPDSVSLLLLTDLHFSRGGGKEILCLKKWLKERVMDYVLISGDLTSGADSVEYRRAAGWIREVELSGMRVAVVPGNHDIGYWRNVSSLGKQLSGDKYHRWTEIIDRPIEPCLRGPFFMSLGLNTAHGISPTRFLNGYLRSGQRARARELLAATPPGHLKVVFCHHPLVTFPNSYHKAIFRADEIKREMLDSGADLLLWGHQHSFDTIEMERGGGKCIAVQGPTMSERTRDGLPGFVSVHWFFDRKVIIKSYRVEGKCSIKEDRVVEYSL
ncbi:MAG: hypothetical protein JL50_14175 [Peptococcaceae bacterium BICA1-7]|nr:MAG: hypothetical protein JL50_14175 [Peptococcaceae bacterium BICA1-7]HBV96412.1 metallophosphoesterase [Desulfotomaculum sp.]